MWKNKSDVSPQTSQICGDILPFLKNIKSPNAAAAAGSIQSWNSEKKKQQKNN